MLFQIDWTIAIGAISHNKRKRSILFIDVRCIYPSIDKDKY